MLSKMQEYQKQYYLTHRDEIRERARKQRESFDWKDYYQKNKESIRRNKRARKMMGFGLTFADWEAMLQTQHHKCLICDVELNEKTRPTLDHDHATGKVRGILCNVCNRALGLFKDKQDVLKKAISYLEQFKNVY